MWSDRVPWFERKFNFDFPAGYYLDILERLRGAPVRLEAKVDGLSTEVLTRRDGDTWSMQENAGHLGDIEPLWVGRLEDFLNGNKELRAADLSNKTTHNADHNDVAIGGLLDSFTTQRGGFIERLEALNGEDFARSALHPRLKTPMAASAFPCP